MSHAVRDDADFHIPPEASSDPSDRAYLAVRPDTYDDPGPRWFEEMGSPMVNGSRAGTAEGQLFHQKAIVGPDLELSTYVFEYAPGRKVGNHFHDVDQIQFVTDGEAWLGKRRLRPGEGLFTPAGNVYGFRAGPKGVRMYEFRRRAPFRYGSAGDDHIESWVRKRDHKSHFFDLETAQPERVGEMHIGATSITLPGTVRTLLPPAGNDSMSLYAVVLEPGARIVTHSEDVQRQIVCHFGEIEISSRTLRRGDGVRWPAHEPVEVAAGAGGAIYVVHRARSQWSKSTDGEHWQAAGAEALLPF